MKRELPDGMYVRIHHFRELDGLGLPVNLPPDARKKAREAGIKFSPTGGLTLAVIHDENDNSVLATGRAVVSKKDQFNRKLGREIATGRALCELDGTAKRRRERKAFKPGRPW